MAQVEQNTLLAEIAKDEDHAYFDTLLKNDPAIDWLGFAAKIYRKSHATSTITSYCKGICAFRNMLQSSHSTDYKARKVTDAVSEIKASSSVAPNGAQTQADGLAYKMLDEFVTYCDASRQFAPRTTRNYFLAVVKVLKFTGVEIDEKKLEDIDLPTPQDILDEYPKNDVIRAILNTATLRIRGFVQVMLDAGFEPTDTAQLQVKDVKFSEAIPRIFKNREKTGRKLEGFLNAGTVETLQQIIRVENKQPGDCLFTDAAFTNYTLRSIRDGYNLAVAKAGYGKLKRNSAGKYFGLVNKIDGHKFGKYHLKIYKKRWFTLAISAGVPEYVAQAMLGRGAYLKQYHIQPLEMRQDFARKILKAVNPYADKVDKQEVLDKASEILGVKVDENALKQLREALSFAGQFAQLPQDKKTQIDKLLGGVSA